jgi:predicted phosphohydrolase
MKIQYASDLHLEFNKNVDFLNSHRLIPSAEILILAGDIFPFFKYNENVKYFDFLSESFTEIYWLPGNHEYYYSDVIRYHKFGEKLVRPNIHVVKDKVVTINEVNLIFTTLWGNISVRNELYIKSHVSDFSCIRINGDDFKPKHFNELHKESLTFLENELELRQNEKNIIITHHVPTLFNYSEEYKNSPLNEAFVVELYDLVNKYQPEAWIYGHSHLNTPEFRIGKTKLLTNQLGYVEMHEHNAFRLNAIVNIE